ncbi:hypothetical protein ACET3Z_019267 [Daucus carota]
MENIILYSQTIYKNSLYNVFTLNFTKHILRLPHRLPLFIYTYTILIYTHKSNKYTNHYNPYITSTSTITRSGC